MDQDELSDASIETEAGDWRARVIGTAGLGVQDLPAWAESSYQTLRVEVTDAAYPCFFGVQAERRGEMFYAFLPKGAEDALPAIMATFAQLAVMPAYEKNNIAVFFEPDPQPLTHQQYHDRFWQMLQSLHDADTHPNAAHQVDPADPAWEFCYQGVEMFVVCGCPSFEQRHSRNLGPGMVLLFQPRSVFIDKITNKVIGRRARQEVRKRLKKWDELGAHPDLGFYGDPGNLEWKQYFLPDDNVPHTGKCPFHSRGAARESASAHAPTLAPSDAASPLRPAQDALWFLWRMDPGSAACSVSTTVELNGDVQIDGLQGALASGIERHASLRARFFEIDGVPAQRIGDAAGVLDWQAHDLRDQTGWKARVQEILRERGERRFDLSGDGLLRVSLLTLSAGRRLLQICTHQILLDGWSLDQLQREVLAGCFAGGEPAAPTLSSRHLDGTHRDIPLSMEQGLAYWREKLRQPLGTLDLPLDRPRPARRQTASARASRVLTSQLHARIRGLARSHDTTPFAVMLGAFALLLQRYSGQNDMGIAVPLLRRQDTASDALGNFTNTTVVRLSVSSTGGFSALVRQACQALAEARVHGDVPFDRLLGSLRLPRSLSNTPLCQVQCSEVPPLTRARYGALETRGYDDGVGRGYYDLTLNVGFGQTSAHVSIDYSVALFHAGTIRELLAHLLGLLETLTQPGVARSESLASVALAPVGQAAVA